MVSFFFRNVQKVEGRQAEDGLFPGFTRTVPNNINTINYYEEHTY